jgi:hypothetical protein
MYKELTNSSIVFDIGGAIVIDPAAMIRVFFLHVF